MSFSVPKEVVAIVDEHLSKYDVRQTPATDGARFRCVRDIIMGWCEKDNNRAAETWRELPAPLKAKMLPFCKEYKFNGQGQRTQTVMNDDGILHLLMALPGEKAKQRRSDFYNSITNRLGESLTTAMHEIFKEAAAQVNEDEVEERMTTLSFEEIFPGSASVHISHDGLVSVVGITMLLSNKDNNHAAEVIRRTDPELFDTGMPVLYRDLHLIPPSALVGRSPGTHLELLPC